MRKGPLPHDLLCGRCLLRIPITTAFIFTNLKGTLTGWEIVKRDEKAGIFTVPGVAAPLLTPLASELCYKKWLNVFVTWATVMWLKVLCSWNNSGYKQHWSLPLNIPNFSLTNIRNHTTAICYLTPSSLGPEMFSQMDLLTVVADIMESRTPRAEGLPLAFNLCSNPHSPLHSPTLQRNRRRWN